MLTLSELVLFLLFLTCTTTYLFTQLSSVWVVFRITCVLHHFTHPLGWCAVPLQISYMSVLILVNSTIPVLGSSLCYGPFGLYTLGAGFFQLNQQSCAVTSRNM